MGNNMADELAAVQRSIKRLAETMDTLQQQVSLSPPRSSPVVCRRKGAHGRQVSALDKKMEAIMRIRLKLDDLSARFDLPPAAGSGLSTKAAVDAADGPHPRRLQPQPKTDRPLARTSANVLPSAAQVGT